MGRRGPIAQKKVIELPSDLAAMPDPPKGLSKEARALWKQVGPELHKMGLLTRIDASAFQMLCEIWADLCDVRRMIDREGLTINRGGEIRRNPLIGVELKLSALWLTFA